MYSPLLNLDFNYFRFLTAGDRQRAYMLILDCLYHERLDHQIQIFHDELYRKVVERIEIEMKAAYPEAQFRADIEQLVDWGNITRQIEGRRVRTLSDISLRRNLLKITEDTFQLLRFLVQKAKPQAKKTVARGFMLLQDLNSMLEEFSAILEAFYDGLRPDENLVRALHLIELMDSKVEDTVSELTGLADQLHSFLEANDEFEQEDYNRLLLQLESYNKAYLSQLTQMVNHLFLRLGNIDHHPCIEDFINSLNRAGEDAETNDDNNVKRKLSSLIIFFNPDSGKLEFYNERVQSELYDALRRIRNYLKIRGDRSLRIQEIRCRIKEMAQSSAIVAANWVDALYSPVNHCLLASEGTPNDREPAPLPRKSSDRLSRTRSAQAIATRKEMTVEQTRELEKRKIELVNLFFLEKILQGKQENSLRNAAFTNADDVRQFLYGVKLARIRKGREAHLLKFSIDKPGSKEPHASFSLEDCEFTCPDHLIRRLKDA